MSSAPWRDRLDVFIGPRVVAVARRPGLRLPWRRAREGEVSAWQAADVDDPVASLSGWLASQPARRAAARVVVSDRLVRYAWIAGAAPLRANAERGLAATGGLHALYGDAADDWQTVLGDVGAHDGALACAIDRAWMRRVTEALAMHGVGVRAIEPLLGRAFNAARRAGALVDATWFVVLEPGRAALAMFDARGWTGVRNQRLASVEDLPVLIEQARLAQGLPRSNDAVVVACGDVAARRLSAIGALPTLRVLSLASLMSPAAWPEALA